MLSPKLKPEEVRMSETLNPWKSRKAIFKLDSSVASLFPTTIARHMPHSLLLS